MTRKKAQPLTPDAALDQITALASQINWSDVDGPFTQHECSARLRELATEFTQEAASLLVRCGAPQYVLVCKALKAKLQPGIVPSDDWREPVRVAISEIVDSVDRLLSRTADPLASSVIALESLASAAACWVVVLALSAED